MSNLFTNHPDDGILLRYSDGELPAREARQVERHLEACWQCRTEFEELKATVAQCMRYRNQVLGAHLPPPPAAWGDLSRGFARIDNSRVEEPVLSRISRPFFNLRWSLAGAAALLVAFGAYYELRETPSVQAASLLKRAVIATAHPAHPVRTVRFRTNSSQFVRAVAAKPSALPASMEAKFEAAHYDSTDPLSARSFQSWRDRQSEKQDEVSTVADPQTPAESCYRIHTIASTGDVAAATLMLRTSDMVPVEGLLEFRDNQWIEFSEFTGFPDGSVDANTASSVEAPERLAVPPSRLAVVPPRSSVSVSDELQVLSALHQIGADLGDPIQVTLTPEKILVSGVGVSPQQRQRIQRTLESMPNVAVQFTEPIAAAAPEGSLGSPAPSGTTRAPAANSKIQSRLEEQVGGPAQFEQFSSQILDVDESALARAYALRTLARQFPPSAEAGLQTQDRRTLRDMAREHVSNFAASVNTLQHALNPVLSLLGGSPGQPAASSQTDWQGSAEELVRASHRVQVLVSLMLGLAPGQSSAQLPSDVLAAIARLRAELDRCQQLLAQEGGG